MHAPFDISIFLYFGHCIWGFHCIYDAYWDI
jgi:hypothetical protein